MIKRQNNEYQRSCSQIHSNDDVTTMLSWGPEKSPNGLVLNLGE